MLIPGNRAYSRHGRAWLQYLPKRAKKGHILTKMAQNGDSHKFPQMFVYFSNFFPIHPIIKFHQKKLLLASKSPGADHSL